MKIKIANLLIVGGAHYRERAEKLKVVTTHDYEIAKLIRADHSNIYQRGNRKVLVTFSIARQHRSNSDSLSYLLKHSAELASIQGPAFFQDDTGQGFRLDNACVRLHESYPAGVKSIHRYELIGTQLKPLK